MKCCKHICPQSMVPLFLFTSAPHAPCSILFLHQPFKACKQQCRSIGMNSFVVPMHFHMLMCLRAVLVLESRPPKRM